MAVYGILGVKYLIETAALTFFLTWILNRSAAKAGRMIASRFWIFLVSAGLQIMLQILYDRSIVPLVFTNRYILCNLLTLWLFWRLWIGKKAGFAAAVISFLLISDIFCQVFATYMIYALYRTIQTVAEFPVSETLLSTGIIWFLLLCVFLSAVRWTKPVEDISPRGAVWICIFSWLFFCVEQILVKYFLGAQTHPQLSVAIFALFQALIGMFFYIAMLMLREQQMAAKQARLNQQYLLQLQHTNEIQTLYQDFRKIRHEMKNQALYVEHLLQNRDYESLEQYYRQMQEITAPVQQMYDSGNRLVNAILWAKSRTAEQLNIPMQLHAALPEELPVEGYHLCSLLVNLLDNAIEASKGLQTPEIRVNLCIRQSYLFCNVENRADMERLAKNPDLHTTKADHLAHGFGISNIKTIAELYHGFADFTTEGDRFTATVMLLI